LDFRRFYKLRFF